MTEQRYCRSHGWVETEDGTCPECNPPRKHVLETLGLVLPSMGVGVALGLGLSEVIRWIF